jgi:hypothetical protein
MSKPAVFFVFLLSLVLTSGRAGAEEVHNRTNYQILLSGIPLANAFFQARRDGQSYSIDAQIATTAVAAIITESKAEMSSKGSVKDGKLESDRFLFRYKYGKRNRRFETTFADGDVKQALIEPRPKKKRKNWIPLQPGDMLAVTDPVAGLVIPADQDPCRSPIAIFDGEARLDLKLAHKSGKTFKTEGFSGPVVVCSLRYEPKAGYRKGHKDIEYVRKLANMEIWFAKSAAMNVYAPVYLSVPTSWGPLTIRATHFDG